MENELNTEKEFVYWSHGTPVGIRVEEVSGMTSRKGRLWIEMARQLYCEHGREGYRDMGHFSSGAPFLFRSNDRISLAHADHFLVVASVPAPPDADLAGYSRVAALGVDAERLDRKQVLNVRERFLNKRELSMIAEDDTERNIVAWTAKESLYKAALTEGLDFREGIEIESLPEIDRSVARKGHKAETGRGVILLNDGTREELELYAYESEGHCVTLAYHKGGGTTSKSKADAPELKHEDGCADEIDEPMSTIVD